MNSSNDLQFLTDTICESPGTNPTDKIILLLVNEFGDTCMVNANLKYCSTTEESLIDYTTSFNPQEKLNLDDFVIKINNMTTTLDLNINNKYIIDYELNLYDIQGRNYKLPILSYGKNRKIDISDLTTGIYYIVIKSDNRVISKSFKIIR